MELYTSIILVLVCVFFIFIFILANIMVTILILLCIILTLVDVMGFMSFWGLTVDTTTSMMSVNYPAHIAHGFLEEAESEGKESRLQENRSRAQLILTM